MQKTTNYNLNKPDGADFYNVEDFNENADIIDAKLKELEDKAVKATATEVGLVKPDGMTTEVDENGEISVVLDDAMSDTSENAVQNKVIKEYVDTSDKAIKKQITTNLLKPTLQSTIISGVTVTNNGDGTYTLNGSAVETNYIPIISNYKLPVGGKLKILGCPLNSKDCNIAIIGISEVDTGEGMIFDSDAGTHTIVITIYGGITYNNLIIKPMLTTDLDATYDDFVPYTGDSGSLNGDVAEIRKSTDITTNLQTNTDVIRTGAYADAVVDSVYAIANYLHANHKDFPVSGSGEFTVIGVIQFAVTYQYIDSERLMGFAITDLGGYIRVAFSKDSSGFRYNYETKPWTS